MATFVHFIARGDRAWFVVGLCVFGLWSGSTMAQDTPRSDGVSHPDKLVDPTREADALRTLGLLGNADVQQELKLTDKQIADLKDLALHALAKLDALNRETPTGPVRSAAARDLFKEMREKSLRILTEEQRHKLEQIKRERSRSAPGSASSERNEAGGSSTRGANGTRRGGNSYGGGSGYGAGLLPFNAAGGPRMSNLGGGAGGSVTGGSGIGDGGSSSGHQSAPQTSASSGERRRTEPGAPVAGSADAASANGESPAAPTGESPANGEAPTAGDPASTTGDRAPRTGGETAPAGQAPHQPTPPPPVIPRPNF